MIINLYQQYFGFQVKKLQTKPLLISLKFGIVFDVLSCDRK